jgi:hypothetical protein
LNLYNRGGITIENIRLQGFVIGSDRVGDDTVWKVRVNDETKKFHRRKFEVASVHEDIQLAKGLEVEFLLGNFRKDGHPVQKAVDVTLL